MAHLVPAWGTWQQCSKIYWIICSLFLALVKKFIFMVSVFPRSWNQIVIKFLIRRRYYRGVFHHCLKISLWRKGRYGRNTKYNILKFELVTKISASFFFLSSSLWNNQALTLTWTRKKTLVMSKKTTTKTSRVSIPFPPTRTPAEKITSATTGKKKKKKTRRMTTTWTTARTWAPRSKTAVMQPVKRTWKFALTTK